jgi:hypothetical protein
MIHPDADRDDCMLYIGELEREIERLQDHMRALVRVKLTHTSLTTLCEQLRNDYSILKADYDAQHIELDNALHDLAVARRALGEKP